jgi:hypothetical protein
MHALARTLFNRLLQEREALLLEQAQEREALDAELDRQLTATLQAKGMRGVIADREALRGLATKKLGVGWLELFKPIQEEALALVDRQVAVRRRADELLRALAQDAEVVAGSEWVVVDEAWASTYGSQGFGAAKYAQGAVELVADVARAQGVEVEVRPLDDGRGYQARAKVAGQVDVEILRRKGLSLREQVRMCWKRGVNPRVYNPFLPHGYEERAGLDFYGGEVKRG